MGKDPTKGKIIGYKKIRVWNAKTSREERFVLELEIPEKARRVFPCGEDGKARAEYARVKKVWRLQGGRLVLVKGKRTFRHHGFYSARPLIYVVGKVVRPDCYDGGNNSCSKGINFFLSKDRARSYS